MADNIRREELSGQIIRIYKSYFQTYDQCNIGQIRKSQMIYVFRLIDPRINEVWLNKILMDQGKSIREFVNFQHFIDILQAIRSYSCEEAYNSSSQVYN